MIKPLATQRLNIRPIEPRDARFRFDLLQADGETLLYGADPYVNHKAAQQHIAGLVNMNKTGFAYHWMIEKKESHQPIGFCDIYLPAPQLLTLRLCALSYGLKQPERRKGLMRETLNACLNFIFNTEGFYRVEATVLIENKVSLSLLESIGFVQEGVQRKKWLCAGERHDVISLALLKHEFELV
jgi:[ribosomal protein S5]-alanine N-acetyltransferase